MEAFLEVIIETNIRNTEVKHTPNKKPEFYNQWFNNINKSLKE